MDVMLPREHGALGQMVFPLATALLLGRPGVPAIALVGTAVFAFLAHEPLLVVLGRRGVRVRREQSGQAWWLLILCVELSLASGIVAIARMPAEWRPALSLPGVLAFGVGIVIGSNRERTIVGEILVACMFSSFAYPTALAAGATLPAATTCTVAFAASLMGATVSVRAVIANTRRPPATRARAISGTTVLLMLALLVALAQLGWMRAVGVWAALPLCGASLALILWPPQAVHLRTVGWTLIAGSSATAAVLVAGLR